MSRRNQSDVFLGQQQPQPPIHLQQQHLHQQQPTHSHSGPNIHPPSTAIPPSFSNFIAKYAQPMERIIEEWSEPIKPYLPLVGRFLIIVTFLEDALRIITQWTDQRYYLEKYMNMWRGVSHLFLILNVAAMVGGSVLVLAQRRTEIAVGGLLAVVISQAIGYGLFFDLNFFLRNLSVIGGLMMVLASSLTQKSGKKATFAGVPLPQAPTPHHTYFQLAGRVLLIFLFIGFVIKGNWSLVRILVALFAGAACVLVIIGFKAKWSAIFLVSLLSVANIALNNFWALPGYSPRRDFLKYDFFQTLSIMGGLLLLINMGPGGISMDEKKKVY